MCYIFVSIVFVTIVLDIPLIHNESVLSIRLTKYAVDLYIDILYFCIGVCDILQFRAHIFTITALLRCNLLHLLYNMLHLFEVPFISYYCRFTVWIAKYGFIVKFFAWILPARFVSLISPFAFLRTVSRDSRFVAWKSALKKYMPAAIRISSRALDSLFWYISVNDKSFHFSINVGGNVAW